MCSCLLFQCHYEKNTWKYDIARMWGCMDHNHRNSEWNWKHCNASEEEGGQIIKATLTTTSRKTSAKDHWKHLCNHTNPWETVKIWYWKHTKINNHWTEVKTTFSAALDELWLWKGQHWATLPSSGHRATTGLPQPRGLSAQLYLLCKEQCLWALAAQQGCVLQPRLNTSLQCRKEHHREDQW